MADDTFQGGTADVIATDHVTTLNGVAVTQSATSPKVQRVKVGFGDDNTFRDSSALFPLPVSLMASPGNVVPVTQALTQAGASTLAGTGSTAGSAVLDVSTSGNASFHLLATAFVGTVTFEQSYDPAGANGTWAAVPVLPEDGLSAPMTTLAINTAAAYVRQFTVGMFGPSLFRVRVTAFTSGSLTAYLKAGPGWYEGQPALAPSAATIGQVQQTPSYTIGTTTGTAPATTGQVARPVRATGTAAVTAATALVAAPAAGTRIYVTNISCTNEGAAATALRLYAAGTVPVAAAATLTVLNDIFDFFMAANGGGASLNLALTPWALPLATALNLFVSVATTWSVTVSYYVAP